jgi:hypothetical protein
MIHDEKGEEFCAHKNYISKWKIEQCANKQSCIYIKLHNNNDQWCEYDMEKIGNAMLICVLLVNICHV